MCSECFSDNKIKNITDFEVNKMNRTIVVKNVPCLICKACGEKIFTDEVSARLEEIIKQIDTADSEYIVIDYNKL